MARPKKNLNPSRQKTVSFRLPDDLMQQMRSLAKQNRRTLSGEVQMAMEKHLETNEDAKSAAKRGADQAG